MAKALDEISTLKRQANTQAETINRYSRRNHALQARVEALQGLVGKIGITHTGGARND